MTAPPAWKRARPIEFRSAGNASRKRRPPKAAFAVVKLSDPPVTLGQSDDVRVLRRQARAFWPGCIERDGLFTVDGVPVGQILRSHEAPDGRYQ